MSSVVILVFRTEEEVLQLFTWTNRPYETMWDHLKIFCYKANVINLLKGKIESRRRFSYIDKDIIEKKSSQVAYSISQAYEYFKAADTVTINTSPLLYFYGMLSLAKALIVFGLILIILGMLLTLGAKIPWLGRLPGDIYIYRKGFNFYFPITTCILISIIISFVIWLVSKK